jgi:hypothetical protein
MKSTLDDTTCLAAHRITGEALEHAIRAMSKTVDGLRRNTPALRARVGTRSDAKYEAAVDNALAHAQPRPCVESQDGGDGSDDDDALPADETVAAVEGDIAAAVAAKTGGPAKVSQEDRNTANQIIGIFQDVMKKHGSGGATTGGSRRKRRRRGSIGKSRAYKRR